MPDHSLLLVQVCESLDAPRTRQREVAALRDAMAELNLKSSLLVTRGFDQMRDERISVDSGEIETLPAWRFLLGLAEKSR